jgi:hypothetical protein
MCGAVRAGRRGAPSARIERASWHRRDAAADVARGADVGDDPLREARIQLPVSLHLRRGGTGNRVLPRFASLQRHLLVAPGRSGDDFGKVYADREFASCSLSVTMGS